MALFCEGLEASQNHGAPSPPRLSVGEGRNEVHAHALEGQFKEAGLQEVQEVQEEAQPSRAPGLDGLHSRGPATNGCAAAAATRASSARTTMRRATAGAIHAPTEAEAEGPAAEEGQEGQGGR